MFLGPSYNCRAIISRARPLDLSSVRVRARVRVRFGVRGTDRVRVRVGGRRDLG